MYTQRFYQDIDILYDLADDIINRKPGTENDGHEKRMQDSGKRREEAATRQREAEAVQQRERENELRERYGDEDYEDDLEDDLDIE